MMRVPRDAARHHLGVERRGDQAPFRGRIGMRDAAAERAARADRMMRDVAHDGGREACRADPRTTGLIERRMAHAGANRRACRPRPRAGERFDAVDVDEMRGTRQPERHDRHEALAARQHAAILGRDLRERRDRLIDGLGRVIAKGAGFIGSSVKTKTTAARSSTAACPIFGTMDFFGLMHSYWCM